MIRAIDRNNGTLDFVGEAPIVVEPFRHVFGLRHHFGNELSVVPYFHLTEVLGMLLNKLCDPAHDLTARARRHLRPRPPLKSSRSGLDRLIHIDPVALRNKRPRLSSIRIAGLEGLARGGIDPPAIDIGLIRFELRSTIQHDGLP